MALKILIVNRRPPYGNALAKEALDTALASSAYSSMISLLFVGDGVFQLVNEQKTDKRLSKSLSSIFSALPLYEINNIYVQKSALVRRGLTAEQLVLPVKCLDDNDVAPLMEEHDTLLSY